MALTIAILIITVVLCVSVHLGVLSLAWRYLRWRHPRVRLHDIAGVVLWTIVGHILEIGIFTLAMVLVSAYTAEDDWPTAVTKMGEPHMFYFSAASYTSMGTAIPATTELRLFVSVEALTGLILITWTASLLFLAMHRAWEEART